MSFYGSRVQLVAKYAFSRIGNNTLARARYSAVLKFVLKKGLSNSTLTSPADSKDLIIASLREPMLSRMQQHLSTFFRKEKKKKKKVVHYLENSVSSLQALANSVLLQLTAAFLGFWD